MDKLTIVDVHQQMEIIGRHRFARQDGVEGPAFCMTARPDTETIPGFVDQCGVFERRQILGGSDRDEGVEGVTILRRLVPGVIQRPAVVWLERTGEFSPVHGNLAYRTRI